MRGSIYERFKKENLEVFVKISLKNQLGENLTKIAILPFTTSKNYLVFSKKRVKTYTEVKKIKKRGRNLRLRPSHKSW